MDEAQYVCGMDSALKGFEMPLVGWQGHCLSRADYEVRANAGSAK